MVKIKCLSSFLIVLLLAGCQKDTTTSTIAQPGDMNTSEGSIIIGDKTFDALNGFVFGQISTSGLKSATLGTCPAVTATLNGSFPVSITFDWGTGCTGAEDGITRSGKITASVSGMMNMASSVITFTFTDFVSEGNKISGVHRITYMGPNSANSWPRYSVFTESRIEFPDKKFITYRAEYIRLHSEGSATPLIIADDVWRIEGRSTGTTREGVNWTASYPSAVVKKASCKWFSSGSILVKPEGGTPSTIDFGDGACDNKATLKTGDKTIDIQL
ncbi:MAG: hypothetical protein GZ094_02560 [Mariniphaga sp.]|nr:hypothetical protein [Mariniphaga sp.]